MENREKQLQVVEAGSNLFAIEIKDGNIRFNLTEMGRKFGTRPVLWLRTEESKRYIECLSKVQKCTLADLVEVIHGGSAHNHGTWANDYRITLEFARWLDPMFSIRVNELVWKILTKQSIVAEPIGGVWPVIRNGRVGYPRRDVLQVAGYSPGSGTVQKLKARYPEHHFMIARIACVSAEYTRFRMEQGRVRQLELKLQENPVLENKEDRRFRDSYIAGR